MAAAADASYAIAVDASGNAYVTGVHRFQQLSHHCRRLPECLRRRRCDAFVTKLNATGTALVYSTYLGGSGDDHGIVIAVDASGNAYVTGHTASSNFPTTAGAYQAVYGGGRYDAFVTKLNATGTALVYSTYLGGSGEDDGYGIAVDASGNAYVTGVHRFQQLSHHCRRLPDCLRRRLSTLS